MKILHTARYFFPHTGGGTIRVYNIAKNLVKLGHEVHLLVHHPSSIEQCNLDFGGTIPLEEEMDGIHIHRLSYFSPNSLYWALSVPLMRRRAIQLMREYNIDVVLSDNPPYLIGTASVRAAKKYGIPMVINVHDVWGAGHYSNLQYQIGAALERYCVRHVQNFVTVSPGLQTILANQFHLPEECIGISPNAIDLDRFENVEQKKNKVIEQYPTLELKADGKYIIFVGIMRQWAGVQFLIQAFAKISRRFPDYKLLLVGGGGDKSFFEKMCRDLDISERVVFTDSMPYEEIPGFIALAKIACAPFPSSKVTDQKQLMSPLKVLEYMAAGQAVVASRVGGMENYIKENETGILFTPENVPEFAEKLSELIENPTLVNRLGENARSFVQDEKYGWLSSARTVETVLKRAITENKK